MLYYYNTIASTKKINTEVINYGKKIKASFLVSPLRERCGKKRKKTFRARLGSSFALNHEIDEFLEKIQERIGIIYLSTYELYVANDEIVLEFQYVEVPKDRVYPIIYPRRGRPHIVLKSSLYEGSKHGIDDWKDGITVLYVRAPAVQSPWRFVSEKAGSVKDPHSMMSISTLSYVEKTIKIYHDYYLFGCFYFELDY